MSAEMAEASPSARQARLAGGVRGLFAGVGAVFSGAGRLLKDAKLRKLALIPLGITVAAYLLVLGLAAFYTDDLLATVWQKPDNWLVYLWYVVVPVIYLALMAILALLFVSIAGVISGPFYEEMVLYVLRDRSVGLAPAGILKGAAYEIGRTLFFLIPALVCGALALLPVIGLPFVVAGALIGWLGLASTAINPALILTGHGFVDQLRFPPRSLLAMLGAGAVVWASLLVPLLGLLAVPAAVVGLTELYARALEPKT